MILQLLCEPGLMLSVWALSQAVDMGVSVVTALHCFQGLDEPFLEQWHQKLHQATSPEDVIIAEAYLAYLHTANHDDW